MLSARLLQSIATITSFVFLASMSYAQTISGDCNVVGPRDVVNGNVRYEINCNNISSNADAQIQRILSLIEDLSASAKSSIEFERTLQELATISQSGLEEFRKSRAPSIEISQDYFEVCSDCYDDLAFINQGGRIARVDEFTYIELVAAGVDIYDETCPFRVGPALQSNWITMDYDTPGFSYPRKEYFDEGDTIGRIQIALSYRNKLAFEQQTLEQYNVRMRYEYGKELDMDTLRRCVDFEYSLAVKIAAITYQGARYEQFFLFDYKPNEKRTNFQLLPISFERGPQGYGNFLSRYNKFRESRQRPEFNSESPTFSVLADFVLERYAPLQ